MSIGENVVAYREPPRAIVDVLDAPPTPWIALSPDVRWMLFVEHAAMPSLADVARPFRKLAGLRVDPATDARHQVSFGTGLVLRDLEGRRERRIELPSGRRLSSLRWSHSSRRFACLLVDEEHGAPGTELWTADVGEFAQRDRVELVLAARPVSAVLSDAFEWMPPDDRGGERMLVTLVPDDRGAMPRDPEETGGLPRGPVVLETAGDTSPLRTYQDLLRSEHDERSFDHHARSQLAVIDLERATVEKLGPARLVWTFDASPDGRWVLVTTIERPFSYTHPFTGFPQRIEVWSADGTTSRTIAQVPAAENIPIEGVRTGPRHVVWSAHGGAVLTWLEALDGGDPRVKVPHRDRWMELDPPFDRLGDARELLRLEHRASGLSWLHDPSKLLARDYDRDRRWTRLRLFEREGGAEPPAHTLTLDDRSVRDRYGDPGSILFEPDTRGRRIVRQRPLPDGEWIFRSGDGDTPAGPQPFLDRMSLATLRTERLFQSGEGELETPFALVEDERSDVVALVTHHETPVSPPNLRLRRFSADSNATVKTLTRFADPAPILRSMHKELVTYERADGVQLSGTLHLPPGHRPGESGERLPIVIWAYPHDYVDADTAGQVSGSPHRFTRIGGPSHLFFALQGYAVLDDASMPIVGDPETMNDTFVAQAVASVKAAIEKLDALGIGDPTRVGIGGHSYGAFMTACLMAHCDLFRAGIARSGAYNRTLTPFGFQAERRTLWEARASYVSLSPLFDADKIKAPLLLIHGEKDENPGTHPMQTERLFHAIKGTGGTARYVSLPHEGHGYRARESILHVLGEQIDWFDRYVKPISKEADPSLS